MPKKSSKKILCIVAAVFLIVGFALGRYFNFTYVSTLSDVGATQTEERMSSSGSFKFINPLLSCADVSQTSERDFINLQSHLQTLTQDWIDRGTITNISLYFRDLNLGPWFAINPSLKFIPASLLKMPFLISLFKIAEDDPTFLEKQILYEGGSYGSSEYFKPEKKIETGKTYSVEELIRRMIVYSDNDAALLLSQLAGASRVQEIYFDLGVDPPSDSGYSVTARTYASFFRLLFNSTYLSQQLSEKALSYLSESKFQQGLRAGIPSNTVVASKFGEREGEGEGEGVPSEKQLHDCGIVYYPRRPYLLCVMTRGSDFNKLADAIKAISKEVFVSVDKFTRDK